MFYSYSDQPVELIDHTCSFLDSPKDLLSFALTCKTVCDVIIPNHIECRHIRCNLDRFSLWQKLVNHPSIASRFVSLEIVESNITELVPTRIKLLDCSDDVEDRYSHSIDSLFVGMQSMAVAISRMSGLTRIHWLERCHTPIPDIFAAWTRCPALEDVQVTMGGLMPYSSVNRTPEVVDSPLWDMSNLRQISVSLGSKYTIGSEDSAPNILRMMDMLVYRCHRLETLSIFVGSSKHDDLTRLFDKGNWPCLKNLSLSSFTTRSLEMLIHRCPSLETLDLSPSFRLPINASQIFERGRWPFLRRLRLSPATYEEPVEENVLGKFIKAHHKLERIIIPSYRYLECIPSTEDDQTEHPNLRALHGWESDILSTSVTRKLIRSPGYVEVVQITSLDTPQYQDVELQKLAQNRSLRALVVNCRYPSEDLMARFAQAVPQLERLHFNHSMSSLTPSSAEDHKMGLAVRLALVSHLPCLTHLSNFLQVESHSEEDMSEFLQHIANALPSLCYLTIEVEGSALSTWVLIERHANGTYSGWITLNRASEPIYVE